MTNRIFLLYGGIQSYDAPLTSAGIALLRNSLSKLPVQIKSYIWSSWPKVVEDIDACPNDDTIIGIGYSGGGWRLTTVANGIHRIMDLMITLDPSPPWHMTTPACQIRLNVLRAVTFQNSWSFFGIGCGVLTNAPGRKAEIVRIPIAMNHLMVQWSPTIRQQVVDEVSRYIGEKK